MKTKIFLAVMLPLLTTDAYRQNALLFDPEPYFSAIVVKNVDSSAIWYQSVLGVKTRSRINEPTTGFKIIMLESPKFLLELIENKSSLESKDILKNKQEGAPIQGFFKIGFKVTSVDACITHLKSLNIAVEHVYTDPSNKKNFLIADPDGNLIQFYD